MNDSTSQFMNTLREFGEQQLLYEKSTINLIASDNAYPRVLSERPSYKGYMIQEGILRDRPFAGAELHDKIEALAVDVACNVFEADYANLQPHSCSQANQAVYQALLDPGDTVMALGFSAGGHLTHGHKANFSGRHYSFVHYGTDDQGLIDYISAENLAQDIKPKLIICGSSSYPRLFDAHRLRRMADKAGSFLMFDLSHEAGLIAGHAIDNPIPVSDVSTMSLDKTLRGPFGGLILARRQFAKAIDRAVHPGTQSSFPIRKLTDSAHALILTQTTWFRDYAHAVIDNAKMLEVIFAKNNIPLITGGTDKHYLVVDVQRGFALSGKEAEQRLERIGILTNRQTLPYDSSNRSANANGLRLGSAWATSRGYSTNDFQEIGNIILDALGENSEEQNIGAFAVRVSRLVEIKRLGDVWSDSMSLDP